MLDIEKNVVALKEEKAALDREWYEANTKFLERAQLIDKKLQIVQAECKHENTETVHHHTVCNTCGLVDTRG